MSNESPETLLRMPEVKRRTGLGRSTIYKYMEKGMFPKQHKAGVRAVGWKLGLVNQWVDERPLAH